MRAREVHKIVTFLLCSDRILPFGIRSVCSPAKVGLVINKLLTTSPVVSWRGWETPPQHHGSTVILCSTTVEERPLSPCVLPSSSATVFTLMVDWCLFDFSLEYFSNFSFRLCQENNEFVLGWGIENAAHSCPLWTGIPTPLVLGVGVKSVPVT